jgi:hypothetical protein
VEKRQKVNDMTVDYEQLKTFVKEAMFTSGGIPAPSAPDGVPHRMPAADSGEKEQDMGDPEANKLYAKALEAREATEQLVAALDDPIYDAPYENAFKASASLRKVLNDIEGLGAHPMPTQRVVAQPADQQKYSGGSNYGGYSAGAWGGGGGMGGMEEGAKIEVSKMTPALQKAVDMYTKMNDRDKASFQAFVLGGATGEK